MDEITPSTTLPQSPLSPLYEARNAIQSGDLTTAFRELVSLFPRLSGYPTYYIVLGECYLAIEEFALAEEAFERALNLSPNSIRPLLLQEIAAHKQRESVTSPDQDVSPEMPISQSWEETANEQPTLAGLFDLEKKIDPERIDFEEKHYSLEHRDKPVSSSSDTAIDIAQLADILTKERPIVKPSEEPIASPEGVLAGDDSSPIYSETFAKILITQGKLHEAQKVYMHLARINPALRSEYREKIAVLEQMLVEGNK